jgi:hypothetical protein
MPMSTDDRAVQHWGAGAVMRNNISEEEEDMVRSVLCKQLVYQTRKCKFLQNFVNTCTSDA